MLRILSRAEFLIVLMLAATGRAAPAPGISAASVEHLLQGAGGAFDVTVSKDFVTVFYLPEPIAQAFASNNHDFSITIMKDTVAVRPLKEPLTANLNIDTKSFHISVVMRTGTVDQAKAQVIFTSAEVRQEQEKRFEDEVQKRLAPLKAEVDQARQALHAQARTEGQQRLAEGMLQRFQAQHLSGITRTDDHVVVRADRAVQIGDTLYVHFAIENRGGASFVVAGVKLLADNAEIPATATAFAPRTEGGAGLGAVPAGLKGEGVLAIPVNQLKRGQPLALQVTEAKGGQVVTVTGLRVE